MLALTRRVGEEIVIDGNIRVIVTAVHGDKVRLAFHAPESVTIDRREVHEQRQAFHTKIARKRASATADVGPLPPRCVAAGVC